MKSKTMTEEQIFKDFPEIFKEKDLPMSQTCMCWGLEVPDSWLPIIHDLCYCMQNKGYYSSACGKFPQVLALQVKEKFGELRFYYRLEYPETAYDDVDESVYREHQHYIDGMIAFAEYQISKLK